MSSIMQEYGTLLSAIYREFKLLEVLKPLMK